ncbi:MAG: hypothetical protein JW744_05085 [Candidatus Diapherotrites archaeon]|uniref:Energy-coupling factor transporter transmembrane protein EcfT n=1 Tax=Candidatus Iainarchaeum sp. TaxID=3101447 RepID=A0A938YXU8_9ARCH|nr:hypothetical protein [Candidatus Diapherotrites archaeon]
MFQYSGRSLFSKVSEKTKVGFLAASLAAAFLFSNVFQQACLLAFLAGLLFAAGYRGFRGLFLGIVPFLLLADLGFFLFLQGMGIDLVQLTLVSNLRILNLFSATAFFTFSTDIFSIVKAMKRARMPESAYLPVYVLFRFLPELEKDLAEIILIQRIRGIGKSRPLTYLRSILVPMLYIAVQKGDEIAIAYYLRKKRKLA